MLIRTSRWPRAAAAVLFLLQAACAEEGPEGTVGGDLVEEVDPIDPALLTVLPEGTSEETLTRGRELYVVCSVCHGLDARGTALGPSLRDTVWIHGDGSIPEIARVTRAGVDPPREFPIPMPPMGGGDMDEAGLQALATYLYALARAPD